MAAMILGTHCEDADHERCSGGRTTPGVLGGWTCSCECHRDSAPAAPTIGRSQPLSGIEREQHVEVGETE